MYIKSVTVENLFGVDKLRLNLKKRRNFLSRSQADAVLYAIGIALDIDCLMPPSKLLPEENSYIRVEVAAYGEVFPVEVTKNGRTERLADLFMRNYCIEERRISVFNKCNEIDFKSRIKYYRELRNNLEDNELKQISDGIALTDTFNIIIADDERRHIVSYFDDVVVSLDKDLRISPKLFGSDKEYIPTDTEESAVIDYLAYLRLNTFWSRVQEVRDIHHEMLPLFIDLRDFKDNSRRHKKLLNVMALFTRLQYRQYIVVTKDAFDKKPFDKGLK